MKTLLDPTFRYHNSADTDLRRTFERVRKEQAALEMETSKMSMYDKKRPHLINADEMLDDPRRGQAAVLNKSR